MNNFMKKNIIFIIVLVSIGVGSFYGGMKYQESKRIPLRSDFEQRIQTGERGIRGGIEGNLLNGEVIEKDEQSIVVKMLDNNSRIIFFSDLTQVSQNIQVAINELKVGNQIRFTGKENSDGSYTAETIQIFSDFPAQRR